MKPKRKRWHFEDFEVVIEPPDGHYFEVMGGDLPGAIKIKSPIKKDIAEQFKWLVDGDSQKKFLTN